MKNKVKSSNKCNWISFIGIFLIVLGDYVNYSGLPSPLKMYIGIPLIIIGVLTLSIDVIKNIKNKVYTPKQLKIIAIIAVTGSIIFHKIHVFYTCIIIVMHFLNKNLKFLFKSLFISMLIGMLTMAFLNLINLIPDYIIEITEEKEIVHNYTLGIGNPNVWYRYYISLLMCGVIVLNYNKLFIIVSFLFGLYMYEPTNSRMGLTMLCLITLFSLLPTKLVKKKISFNKIIPYSFVLGMVLSVVLTIILHDNVEINRLLSGRINLFYTYLTDIGLFSKFQDVYKLPLDNIYLRILYFGGIYGAIFYVILFFASFYKAQTKHNYNLFMIMLLTLCYGFIENFASQNESMYLICLLIMLLDKNKIQELNNEEIIKEKTVS